MLIYKIILVSQNWRTQFRTAQALRSVMVLGCTIQILAWVPVTVGWTAMPAACSGSATLLCMMASFATAMRAKLEMC